MSINNLKHCCHNPPQFTMIGSICAFSSQHVELIENQHPRFHIQEVENLFEGVSEVYGPSAVMGTTATPSGRS